MSSAETDEYQPDGFDLMSKETLALIARDLMAKVKEVQAENARLHRLTEGDTTSIYAEAAALRKAIQDAEEAILGSGDPGEADLRLHESLSPLWQALNDA